MTRKMASDFSEGDADSAKTIPDPDSKPTVSGTRTPTPTPRGLHGNRETPDKLITSPFPEDKPESRPDRNTLKEKMFLEGSARHEWVSVDDCE
jgi:hypothetical protein